MEDFIKKVLDDPETFGKFTIKSYDRSIYDKKEDNIFYGEAVDRLGMTYVRWCTSGHSVNYFGDKLEPNIGVEIRKDGDTRYAFNGYCFNEENFKMLLNSTW